MMFQRSKKLVAALLDDGDRRLLENLKKRRVSLCIKNSGFSLLS